LLVLLVEWRELIAQETPLIQLLLKEKKVLLFDEINLATPAITPLLQCEDL